MNTTRARWLLLSALGALPACNSSDALRCGEGTEEEDGACVASGTDTQSGESSGTSTSGPDQGSSATAGEQTSAGGKADDSPDQDGPAPYAACPGGSDVECVVNESCDEALGMCAEQCSRDNECPSPADGTAVQRCEDTGPWSAMCVLYCGADGFDCPTGMTCREVSLCEASGGGTSGGWGTTGGGGCENPTLEICTWD